jgi:hypothetical protein
LGAGGCVFVFNQAGYAPGVGVGNPYCALAGVGGYPADICLAAGSSVETPVWAATLDPTSSPEQVALYSGGVNNNPAYLVSNFAYPQSWAVAPLTIGANVPNSLFFTGYVGEVVIYNTLLTTNQIAGVSQYLKNKWGST